MLTEGDFYSIFFLILLGIALTVFITLILLKSVKLILKSYKKNAQRKARKKMRALRNMEIIKNIKNKNISAIL
jgi:hypothetical protein